MSEFPSPKPNFSYLEMVLQKKVPPRPVLFELILGSHVIKHFSKSDTLGDTELEKLQIKTKAFFHAGYDYVPVLLRGLEFSRSSAHAHAETKSLNEGAVILDQASFNSYVWPEIASCNFDLLEEAKTFLPNGMKLIPYAYDGILENAIGIIGYENLCYMLYDEPDLVEEIFRQIGSRIEAYYYKCLEYDTVGAIILNDDWGFNTQTMLSPHDLRKFVFPYYMRVAKRARELGKYTILHSCGYYQDIIEDIINELKIDARHSYEDNIICVEQAYEDLKGKIAIIGGIDVDFLVRSNCEEIYNRSKALLEQSKLTGGYALGSGNSIPEYVPLENYIAMVKAAWEEF